ncbi:MAG: YbaK/EbsC family protein [Caldilineales bacterium]
MNDLAPRARLARFIEDHTIAARLVVTARETPTVPLAAAALGCTVEQIVKSVLVLTKTEPPLAILVISNGVAVIDFQRLAAILQLNRKRLRLAPADVVLARTGYAVGGVPPFGFAEPLPTLIDPHVFEQAVVFGGGGDHQTMLEITPAELLRVTGGQIAAVRQNNTALDRR